MAYTLAECPTCKRMWGVEQYTDPTAKVRQVTCPRCEAGGSTPASEEELVLTSVNGMEMRVSKRRVK